MTIDPQSPWWPRLVTFLLAALAALSAVYWGLRWPAPAAGPAAYAMPEEAVAQDGQALARLLGQVATAGPVASVASRYVLTGVLAGPGPGGAALIAVDGKPAKPYRVGSLVADNLFLQSVSGRRAVLAAGAGSTAPALVLEMTPLPR